MPRWVWIALVLAAVALLAWLAVRAMARRENAKDAKSTTRADVRAAVASEPRLEVVTESGTFDVGASAAAGWPPPATIDTVLRL